MGITQEHLWAPSERKISPEMLLDIDEQLERLFREDSQPAKIVELRVFGGFTFAEIAARLEIQPTTAERRWHYAAAILRQRIDR